MVAKRLSEGIQCTACALVLLSATQCSLANPTTDLAGPVWTNGQFQFTLNGAAGIPYVIESSPDLFNWTPVVTNSDFSDIRLISLDAPDSAGFYRFTRASGSIPIALAFGAVGNISLNGNGVSTDSYNSHDPRYSTNGQYTSSMTRSNGNIASEERFVNLGGHTIDGNLYLGPTASYISGSNQVTGQIYSDYNVQFPDVTLPSGASSWPIAVPTTNITTTNGISTTNTVYDFQTSGNYIINQDYSIIVEAGITVNMNVTSTAFYPAGLQIQGGMTNSGTAKFYFNGPSSLTIAGNTVVNANGRPENLWYFGLPSLTNMTISSSSAPFVGVIYAPEANILLSGGGGGSSIIIGSCITGTLNMSGSYTFHFDESLVNFWPYF